MWRPMARKCVVTCVFVRDAACFNARYVCKKGEEGPSRRVWCHIFQKWAVLFWSCTQEMKLHYRLIVASTRDLCPHICRRLPGWIRVVVGVLRPCPGWAPVCSCSWLFLLQGSAGREDPPDAMWRERVKWWKESGGRAHARLITHLGRRGFSSCLPLAIRRRVGVCWW